MDRWIDMRIDILANFLPLCLGFYLVYVQRVSPSVTGFSLSMAVTFSNMILWWIFFSNQFEVEGEWTSGNGSL